MQPRREVEMFHAMIQIQLQAKITETTRTEPFDLPISFMPFTTLLAVMSHCDVQGEAVLYDAGLIDFHLDAIALDKFIGHSVAPLPEGRSTKKPDFYMTHPGPAARQTARGKQQPQGSVRYSYRNSSANLRCSIALFKGRTLTHGSVPEDFPENDPPDGGAWVYSLAARNWLPKAQVRESKRELRDLYPYPVEWAQYSVAP